jgi:hypothetical protein
MGAGVRRYTWTLCYVALAVTAVLAIQLVTAFR